MVTGIEAASIIIAILPLVVNQLDAYVQGLETIKTFRTKRYRRELESYLTRLGTQQAIFLNTLEQLLEDVVDSDDEVRELIGNPTGPSWQDAVFQAKLQKRLGRDHDLYIKMITMLASLLQGLSDKLGLGTNSIGKNNWEDAGAIEREVKRFKDVFSKSIYTKLLGSIGTANSVLQTLTQQSLHRELARCKRRTSSKPLAIYRKARTHARCLYNAVVKGKCWKCICRDEHLANIRLDPRLNNDLDLSQQLSFCPRFRLALSSTRPSGSSTYLWPWQEVDTEPAELVKNESSSLKSTSSMAISNNVVPDKRVQFAPVASGLWSTAPPKLQPPSEFVAISDMCAALCTFASDHDLPAPLGFISDDAVSDQRYNVYLIKKLGKEIQTRTLEDLLTDSGSRTKTRHSNRGALFSRQDRLFLATTLACSVLQLHGSWLKAEWRSRDIVFTKDENTNIAVLEHPYISWHISDMEDSLQVPQLKRTVSALIRSEVLFPLGLALVELSLGQTLADMREAEDDDSNDALADLKTASRLLQDVYCESGTRYGDVVEKCLFWSGSKDAELDDEALQQAVFDSIVSPLIEDFNNFRGKSRIH